MVLCSQTFRNASLHAMGAFLTIAATVAILVSPHDASAQDDRIDINSATAADLETLRGIGPVKAEAIIRHRESVGRFTRPTDLMDVPGIGQHTYDGLCARIEVEGNPGCEPLGAPREGNTAADTPVSSRSLVNINLATAEELQALPRIGPALSERIVEYRHQNGLFTSVDGLDAVSGIGPATVDQILPLAAVIGDINCVTAEELQQLHVPAELAEAIVAQREQNGPFASLDDLSAIDGITEILVQHLRPFLTVETESPIE